MDIDTATLSSECLARVEVVVIMLAISNSPESIFKNNALVIDTYKIDTKTPIIILLL